MDIALSVSGLSKSFAGRRVVNDVSFTIERGQIVGLVGQNGCGKSTLIKMLSGIHAPDEAGEMVLSGRRVPLPAPPGGAPELAFVHQDLGLFLQGSILENVRVGRYNHGFAGKIPWREEYEICLAALARLGLDFDPHMKVADLSQVDRALIAIARAVDQASSLGRPGVVVLDEPTSYLPRDGVERLFESVRALAASGYGVLFVSHRIEEVRELANSILVMRSGDIVDTLPATSSTDTIITSILGRKLSALYPDHLADAAGDIAFTATNVTGVGVSDVSFEAREGEIYGITGLLGMGQERILYLLFGAQEAEGSISIGGEEVPLSEMTPRRAVKKELALLPGDRVKQSSVQEATVLENLTLITLSTWVACGRIRHHEEQEAARAVIAEYNVTPPVLNVPMSSLSGGNQQKALLAKWVTGKPKVLLLHEPTQGVDIGAKAQIFSKLREIASQGTAVVVATTEYEDLAQLCDRVMVMRSGKKVVELAGASLTEDRLVDECYRETVGDER